MARAGFGGGGDYSSLLGSLYNYNKTAKRAKEDADDADAQDRWENGVMGDEEWLAWIAKRITDYASDAKRQQRWIEYQRRYQTAISESQAIDAYQNGGSEAQLAAYYQGRLAALGDVDSNEKRDLTKKLNEVLDQQASEDIETGSQAIIDRINRGTGTYEELQKFLQRKLGEARGNSQLRESIENQLQQVKDRIFDNKFEGDLQKLQYLYESNKLSAGAYAAKVRNMAKQVKNSDPQRYYQLLTAAARLGQAGGSGGGGGGRGGSRGGGGYSRSAAASMEELYREKERLATLEKLFKQSGYRYGVTVQGPDGPVTFTPDSVRRMDDDRLRNFDNIISISKHAGDADRVRDEKNNKSLYIADFMTAHNTILYNEDEPHVKNTVLSAIRDAETAEDPYEAQHRVSQALDAYVRFNDDTQNKSKLTTTRGDGAARTTRTVTGTKTNRPDPALVMANMDWANNLKVLTNPNSTPEALTAAEVNLGAMGVPGEVIGAAASVSAHIVDTKPSPDGQLPKLVQVVTREGTSYMKAKNEPLVRFIEETGSWATVNKVVPDVSIDRDNQKFITIFVGKNPHPVLALADRVAVPGFNTPIALRAETIKIKTPKGTVERKVKAGAALTPADAQYLRENGKGDAVGVGSGLPTWQVVVPQANGVSKTYYQDPDTLDWHAGSLPIRGVDRDPSDPQFIQLDADGRPVLRYRPYSSEEGMAVIYAGDDPKAMQALVDGGILDSIIQENNEGQARAGRDALGNLTPSAKSANGMYYRSPDEYSIRLRQTEKDSTQWDSPEARRRNSERKRAESEAYMIRHRQSEKDPISPMTTLGYSSEQRFNDSTAKLAASMGINVTGTITKPKPAGDLGIRDMKAATLATGPIAKDLQLGSASKASVKLKEPPPPPKKPKTKVSVKLPSSKPTKVRDWAPSGLSGPGHGM